MYIYRNSVQNIIDEKIFTWFLDQVQNTEQTLNAINGLKAFIIIVVDFLPWTRRHNFFLCSYVCSHLISFHYKKVNIIYSLWWDKNNQTIFFSLYKRMNRIFKVHIIFGQRFYWHNKKCTLFAWKQKKTKTIEIRH